MRGDLIQFGHQLIRDDVEHLFQLLYILGRKALFDPVHDGGEIAVAHIVVVDILLRYRQMILPLVIGRLLLGNVALLDEAVDLIGGIGGEMFTKLENSAMVGCPRALMISMQKVSTVVRLASRV